MSEKDKLVVAFVTELIYLPHKAFQEARNSMLKAYAGNAHMTDFLLKAFEVAQTKRLILLE
jgi:hypothetical protein